MSVLTGNVEPAATLAGAVATLARLGGEGAAIAGGTWVMRGPWRGGTPNGGTKQEKE